MSHRVTRALTGLRVLAAFSDNDLGTGSLTVTGTDAVTWTPPGKSVGTAVTIQAHAIAVVSGPSSVGRILVQRDATEELDTTEDPALVFCDGRKCTLEELLQVEDAIESVEKQAQSASAGEENVYRAKLAELEARKQKLEARYARESGARPFLATLDLGDS